MHTAEIGQVIQQKFGQLAEPALQATIAEVGQLHHFRAGEIIMDYGSYVRMVPLIVEGTIKVTREDEEGRELLLYFLTTGDTCSMSFSCCMTSKRSAIRTLALEDSTVIGIPVQYVDQWMTRFQSWKNFVMRSYDERMHELVKVIDSIAFANLDTRLQDYLEARKASTGSPVIAATHKEIAADMNVSREAISRLLKKMEQMEIVSLGRNEVTVL